MGKSITIARLGYPHFESINEADYSNSSYIEDITNGLMVNFSLTYEWTDIDTCKITNILWHPCIFKDDGTLNTDGISFKDNGGFSFQYLTIKIGDTQVGGDDYKYTLNTHTLNTLITLTQISTKNIPVIFKYNYTNENGRTYTLEIPNIKIPKPSRYEENVVFNKDGLNEMIDYFKKYPVIDAIPSPDFGKIRITMGTGNTKDIAIHGCEDSTNTQFKINTNLLPSETESFYLGNNFQIWKGLYAETLGDSNTPIENAYITNGIFNNSIKGKYEGLPNGLTGDSININDKFKVDDQGNVTMQGNITWGTNNPIQCVYHRPISADDLVTRPDSPANNTTSFNDTNPDEWHKVLHSKDAWASMSYNGGKTWNTAIRINAVDGAKGDTGEWDDASIMRALKDAQAAGVRGLFTFPGDPDNSTTKLGINADAILANIASFGKIEMDPGKTYDPNNDYSLQGGFITFHIPTPFSTTKTLNSNGWVGRLGYLRGNGDGNTATAGLGLVLHTVTTWNQVYNANLATVNGVQIGNKLHLVLATLMFTQSGLGIMLAMNTTDSGRDGTGATWLTQDRLTDNKPHYLYKYTAGSSTTWTVNSNAEKKWRLWIHEDNGRLYYSNANDGKIYLWSTE